MNIKYGAMMKLFGGGTVKEPTNAEKELCRYLCMCEGGSLAGYPVKVIEGEEYKSWNLYMDRDCVFSVQESDDGLLITWSDKSCTMTILNDIL